MNPYIVVAIVGWTIWSFGAKMASNHIHPMWLQVINYAIGFMCIPIFLSTIKKDISVGFDMTGIIWAVVASIFGLIAYASFTLALRNGNAGTTTILCTTYPFLTLILSMVFLGEPITAPKVVGVVAVLLGMGLIAY
jgi:drug/metabolite transporter (DMT)-like permease